MNKMGDLLTIKERLVALRQLMAEKNLDAYIVYSADAHQSEYVAGHWQARAWITGFSGSSGTAVILSDKAGLWTDGRYFIQAEEELSGTGVDLFKVSVKDVPEMYPWIKDNVPEHGRVGFDGRTCSVSEFEKIKKELSIKHIEIDYNHDLIGLLWEDRPSLPSTGVFFHGPPFEGATRSEKLKVLRDKMKKKSAGHTFIAALDDIAWLLNIRGQDVPYTPLVYAYCMVSLTSANLYIDDKKINDDLRQSIESDGYSVLPYDEARKALSGIQSGDRLLYSPDRMSIYFADALNKDVELIKDKDITTHMKAQKNEIELENIKKAHIKEGAVIVRLLKWLDDWAKDDMRPPLYEGDIHDMLDEMRKNEPHYLGPSFKTISAYGKNAASMHYDPKSKGDEIRADGFLLIDTGGQYMDGTTDITRTIVLGDTTDEMRRDFTLVLKGHIALSKAVFLHGTAGSGLDVLARMHMWRHGVNYRSGTGHGIGYCLGVHEGPQYISMRQMDVKLEEGMIITNEPGVYKENRYGIRTENVMAVKKLFENDDGVFMGFETISLAPIDMQAIDIKMLDDTEIAYLIEYHQVVSDKLSPYLNDEEQAWLARIVQETTALTASSTAPA